MLLRLFGLSLLLSSSAYAIELPMFMRDGSTRFLARSLGTACYSMDSVDRGLPCNPAFIAKERKSRFDGDVLLGSNSEYLKDAEAILRGKADTGTVARLSSRREYAEAEAALEASFQTSKWGASIEPYRVIMYARVENAALPNVDFVAAEQQSIKTQFASYLQDNFYAGLQLRYTHIRFMGDYFSSSEVLAEQTPEMFSAKTQELVYLEPGIAWSAEDYVWQPQISFALTQWGITSEKTEQYPITPVGLLGASIKPLVPLGLLEVGVQGTVHDGTRDWRDAIRFALSYKLGILQAVMSASEYNHAAGFLLMFKSFTSGLSYWSENNERSVYIQFGVTL